ncbi:hypothetical protein ACSU64_11695 [Bacillaceae bacterium C204]|uniref:hypothetical protein n=1 Tax=Neobacillus sp. 204 TaxID=3383351 RepID=UPI00397A8E23
MSKKKKEKSVKDSDNIETEDATIDNTNNSNEIPLDLNSLMNNLDLKSLTGKDKNQMNSENSLDINSLMSNIDMNTLMKNVDMGSLMNVATNLLKDDSLKNSAKDLGNSTQIPILNLLNGSDKKENGRLALLSEKLEKIANDFSELKKELLELKEQNQHLTQLVNKLLQSDSKKKSK